MFQTTNHYRFPNLLNHPSMNPCCADPPPIRSPWTLRCSPPSACSWPAHLVFNDENMEKLQENYPKGDETEVFPMKKLASFWWGKMWGSKILTHDHIWHGNPSNPKVTRGSSATGIQLATNADILEVFHSISTNEWSPEYSVQFLKTACFRKKLKNRIVELPKSGGTFIAFSSTISFGNLGFPSFVYGCVPLAVSIAGNPGRVFSPFKTAVFGWHSLGAPKKTKGHLNKCSFSSFWWFDVVWVTG